MIKIIELLYYSIFALLGFITTSFIISSVLFGMVGFVWIIFKSVSNEWFYYAINQITLVFQVLYGTITNICYIANDMTTRIGAWLLITDNEFQDNFNKILYEDKYNDTFDKFMEVYSQSETKYNNMPNNSILLEHTPIGNIVMYYDTNDKCLAYYSNRSLTTRQLQSVGRKFIIQFCCPQIIDFMKDEKEDNIKTPQKESTQTENKQEQPKHGLASKSGVMTKFKNNTKDTIKKDNNLHVEPTPFNFVNMFKFLRKGPLTDFSFTQKIKIHPYRTRSLANEKIIPNIGDTNTSHHIPYIDKSKLSFSEYKRLMKTKQQNNDQKQELLIYS